jgi:hypothetical protein
MRIAFTILLLVVFSACASKKLPQKMSEQSNNLNVNENVVPTPVMQTSPDSSGLWDIDGNHYKTVLIGSQTWMAENLRVTRFMDSMSFKYAPDSATWKNRASPAFCWINNDSATYA